MRVISQFSCLLVQLVSLLLQGLVGFSCKEETLNLMSKNIGLYRLEEKLIYLLVGDLSATNNCRERN